MVLSEVIVGLVFDLTKPIGFCENSHRLEKGTKHSL